MLCIGILLNSLLFCVCNTGIQSITFIFNYLYMQQAMDCICCHLALCLSMFKVNDRKELPFKTKKTGSFESTFPKHCLVVLISLWIYFVLFSLSFSCFLFRSFLLRVLSGLIEVIENPLLVYINVVNTLFYISS